VTLPVIGIWRAPIALALVTVLGLVAALVADGLADALSWLSLAIPVAVICRYVVKPDRTGS
jgi:hypothetical protein